MNCASHWAGGGRGGCWGRRRSGVNCVCHWAGGGRGGCWGRRRSGVNCVCHWAAGCTGGCRGSSAGSAIRQWTSWCSLQCGLIEFASDLVLDRLLVGLLVHVNACVAGQPEKRLTGTLRIHDFLTSRCDVEGTISGSLVGLTLMFGDNLGDSGDFSSQLVVRFQNIIDLLITVFGDSSQFFAKVLHAIEGVLKGLFVGAVFLSDLGSLLGALTKRVSDGIGCDSLLPGESRRNGVLQRLMKLSEVRLDRSAITNSSVKRGHRCDTHPLRANQQC